MSPRQGPDHAVAAPALPLAPFVSHYAGSRMRDVPQGLHAGLLSCHLDLIVSLAFIQLNLDDVAAADRIFTQLADGGRVTVPLQQTFWAQRYGSVVDRFGIPWGINCGERDGV